MSTRERLRQIMHLALPIVGGMLSQNLLNLVDTAFVGRLGGAALGAVGMGGFVVFMLITLVMGPAAGGVQAIVARRVGEERHSEAAVALNGGILLALVFGIPVSLAAAALTPSFFPLLNPDPDIVAAGVPYVQVRMLSLVPVSINYAFRGFWNGISMPKMYLRTLLLIHTTNIVLDWVLIFGNLGAPALGTFGAGLASAIATCVGSLFYIRLGFRYARDAGFAHGLPDRTTIAGMIRLGVPVGLQQFSFFLGFTILFWIIGRVGTAELGVATVLVNMTLVAILPGMGLGMAAATFAGQARGRGDIDEAERWGWAVVRVACVYAVVLASVFVAIPDVILGIFVVDDSLVALARWPLRVVGIGLIFDVSGIVLSNALQGVGDMRRVLFVSLTLQWGLMLPAAYTVGPLLGHGLLAIWIVLGIWRGLGVLAYGTLWHGRAWADIHV
jgi:putative MATE family efflux protein